MLYFIYTWVWDTPYYYENFNCESWYEIVRLKNSDPLMDLLEELKEGVTLDTIVRGHDAEYFKTNSLTTSEALKNEQQLFTQVKILAAIDYYGEKKMFGPTQGYIVKETRYIYKNELFFY